MPSACLHTVAHPAPSPALDHAVAVLQVMNDPAGLLTTQEQRAVAMIFMSYRDMMHVAARRVLACPADAEDVVHEIFARLPQLIRGYRHRGLGGWLRRVAVTHALMVVRRRRTHDALLGEIVDALGSDPREVDDEALRAAMVMLPVALREVVVLRFFLQLPHADIAELLELTVTASELRVHRAVRRLRDLVVTPVAPKPPRQAA
ncbi:MAG: sigma-70 family RNA polymerase sigma factor [Gemmatimonadaceae bacterium]|nr:sigma-70 family RNA polymerase sigma factor [Gemmatimonadaceae bacterium]